MSTDNRVRTFFVVISVAATIFGIGWMLKLDYPIIGFVTIGVAVLYLLYELGALPGIVREVPAMLRLLIMVMVICTLAGISIPRYFRKNSKPATIPTPPAPQNPEPPKPEPTPETAKVTVEVMLGADKGIGGPDALVVCGKAPFQCLSEKQSKSKVLTLDVGPKNWARVIFVTKNISNIKVTNSIAHITSNNPISLDFAPEPNPKRLPRNVIDINGGDLQPFAIAKGGYSTPIDIFVPPGIENIELHFKIFGDNLPAHESHLRFAVKR